MKGPGNHSVYPPGASLQFIYMYKRKQPTSKIDHAFRFLVLFELSWLIGNRQVEYHKRTEAGEGRSQCPTVVMVIRPTFISDQPHTQDRRCPTVVMVRRSMFISPPYPGQTMSDCCDGYKVYVYLSPIPRTDNVRLL